MTALSGRGRPAGAVGDRPDDRSIEAALVAVVDRHPDVVVAAVLGEAGAVSVAVPESVPVPRSATLAPSALPGLLLPSEIGAVASVWVRARARGIASERVRLQRDPGRAGLLHGFDLRSTHGVVVFAYVPATTGAADGAGDDADGAHGARVAVVTKNQGGVILDVDSAFSDLLGWRAKEVVGCQTADFVHPDDVAHAAAGWTRMVTVPGPAPRVRLRHLHADGHYVWVEVRNTNRLSDPAHGDVHSELTDLSDEVAAIEALQRLGRLFNQVADTVPVGLFAAATDGSLLFTNHRLEELTGVGSSVDLRGQFASLDDHDRARLEHAVAGAQSGAESTIEVSMVRSDGSVRHCSVAVRPFVDFDGAPVGVTGSVGDVTDAVSSRQDLETRANTDPLTGCANRAATLAALGDILRRQGADPGAPGSPTPGVAVVFLDLDDLKGVNDRFGHAAGDRLLCAVAERITSSVRSGDVVGRYGGDEFVVVCPGVPAPALALKIGESVLDNVNRPIVVEAGQEAPVGASLGVAWTARARTPPERLVALADEAMYTSKRAGTAEAVLAQLGDAGPTGSTRSR